MGYLYLFTSTLKHAPHENDHRGPLTLAIRPNPNQKP